MKGHNVQVMQDFVKNYKNSVVKFETLEIKMDESAISKATGVPSEGSKWFKQHPFEADYSKFLLPSFEKLSWENGIHVNNLKPVWKNPLIMVQSYITCEVRYHRVLWYHLRFLMHFNGDSKLNLPFYLCEIIQNMISRI